MEPEVHIAGVLVHVRLDQTQAVAGAVAALPNVEVHAMSERGRLVVVCECASGEALLALIARIRELPDVIDAALVYQHAEAASAMDEEIRDDPDAPRFH